MLETMLYLFLMLVVVGALWWAIQQLLPMLPLPEPFRRIVYVLLVLVMVLVVVWVIAGLLGVVSSPRLLPVR